MRAWASLSRAQALQTSAQAAQTSSAKSLSRDMKPAASRQIAAQSMARAMERFSSCTFGATRHAAAQRSHAPTQVARVDAGAKVIEVGHVALPGASGRPGLGRGAWRAPAQTVRNLAALIARE
jgi:hypothetical protein